jgi:mannose-6-phosphate isomerase-like protein (cupin superfamily)
VAWMVAKYLYAAAILSGLVAAQVPLEQEPRHHLEFANGWLRIFSPRIPPGDTTLEHLHSHDEATVCIHGSETRSKQSGSEWSNAGRACVPGQAGGTQYTGKPGVHTVQNAGSGVFHLVLVENMRESGWKNNEPLTVAGMKMTRENRSFRIYETELSSSGVVAHSHGVPTVVIIVSGEAMAGDKRLDQPGSWVYIPAGDMHQITAQGKARLVEIEVR